MYAKLFASLYQGTLRGCPNEILVFTNMLAHADANGVVDRHWRSIAEETGLPRESVEKAILTLESPDPESRSPENEGRRLLRLDDHRAWGWQIVNHAKYREIRNEDDRREQNRLAQERWRNKQKDKISKPSKPQSAHTEVEVEVEASKPKTSVASLPDWLKPEIWIAFKKHRGAKFGDYAQKLIINKLAEFHTQGHDPNRILENSIANGWKSVFIDRQQGQSNGYTNERDESRKRAYQELTGKTGATIEGVSTRVD